MYSKDSKFTKDGYSKGPADIDIISIPISDLAEILHIDYKKVYGEINSEDYYWLEDFYDFDKSKSKNIQELLLTKGKLIKSGKGGYEAYTDTYTINNEDFTFNAIILNFRKVY